MQGPIHVKLEVLQAGAQDVPLKFLNTFQTIL